ncbi:MAG: secD [Caulobacter sp.]|nr:secD [Caulobacter sp.]
MMSLARWKIIAITMAVLFGVLFTLPNLLTPGQLAALPGFLPHKTLNLGLDLRGGSYLLLEVDIDALRAEKLKNLTEDVRNTLNDADLGNNISQTGNTISIRLADPNRMNDAVNALNKVGSRLKNGSRDINISTTGGAPEERRIQITYSDLALTEGARDAVDRSIEVVRKRLDKTGTKEVSITPQGADRIVIQAPGESDPENLKKLIGTTAKLTFQMVVDVSPEGPIPVDSEVLPYDEGGPGAKLVVKRRAVVSGEDLTSAKGEPDPQNGGYQVAFRFNAKGGSKFAHITTDNIGKRFAAVLDGRIISAPTIQGAIIGGQGVITGHFEQEKAVTLGNLLSSGALPAPLKVEQQRVVTAELGADAIKAGAISLAIGALLIFGFIMLAYGLFGVFAALALLANILLLTGFMSMTQSTLTLPGIAGLILTLAVAVDANVLIYERMRDEARSGRTPMAAADAGYRRALVSILDANVTTLISALIMMMMGQGPVRGFAITLMVGVFTSVFTAVLFTQVLISYWFRVAKPKKLPIL